MSYIYIYMAVHYDGAHCLYAIRFSTVYLYGTHVIEEQYFTAHPRLYLVANANCCQLRWRNQEPQMKPPLVIARPAMRLDMCAWRELREFDRTLGQPAAGAAAAQLEHRLHNFRGSREDRGDCALPTRARQPWQHAASGSCQQCHPCIDR